jgi:hypothetical protein
MSFPVGDTGVPEYEHLMKLAEENNIVDPRLELLCPLDMAEYWRIYCDLSKAKLSDQPISYSEMLAYADLHGHRFSMLSIHVIKELDMLWLQMQDQHRRSERMKNV